MRVSESADNIPRWAPDGSAVYFMSGSDLIRVDVDTRQTPPRLADERVVQSFGGPVDMWDLLPDGLGLVHIVTAPTDPFRVEWADSSGTQVHGIVNWVEELERLVPMPD